MVAEEVVVREKEMNRQLVEDQKLSRKRVVPGDTAKDR